MMPGQGRGACSKCCSGGVGPSGSSGQAKGDPPLGCLQTSKPTCEGVTKGLQASEGKGGA